MSKRSHNQFAADSSEGTSLASENSKRTRVENESDGEEGEIQEASGTAHGILAPFPACLSKWISSAIPTSYPPLPEILDPMMETAALTHPAKSQQQNLNYERLEFIGDAWLETISSEFIYESFPTLSPGKCSHLREMCVRNSTLAEFSLYYGLDKRANLPEEFSVDGRQGGGGGGVGAKAAKKEQLKVQGDIFEAYVGAIIKSDRERGLQRASAWLKILWGNVLRKHIIEEEKAQAVEQQRSSQGGTTRSPKEELEYLILAKGVRIEYRDVGKPGKMHRDHKLVVFSIGCYLTGWGEKDKLLGKGTALGKKEAGQKAAQEALSNKKAMAKYIAMKKAFMDALVAEEKAGKDEEAEGRDQ